MKRKTNTIVQITSQQGDVCLRKLNKMPAGEQTVVSKKRCVLSHGESGHSHVVEQDGAELIRIGERMLLTIKEPAEVKHEEHKSQTLSPGIWEIGQVNEYDYFSEMTRKVID